MNDLERQAKENARFSALAAVKNLTNKQASDLCRQTDCPGFVWFEPSRWASSWPFFISETDDERLRGLWNKARASKNPSDEQKFADEFVASITRREAFDREQEKKEPSNEAEALANVEAEVLLELRTGKPSPRGAVKEVRRFIDIQIENPSKTQPDLLAEAKSLRSALEEVKAGRGKDLPALAKRLAKHYVETAKRAWGFDSGPTSKEMPMNEKKDAPKPDAPKPDLPSEASRNVADYDCRGHWWDYTPGFLSLTLIGAVAGLVRRSFK